MKKVKLEKISNNDVINDQPNKKRKIAKTEKLEYDPQLFKMFVELCKEKPEGVSDKDLMDRGMSKERLVPVVNKLLRDQLLELKQMRGELFYLLRDAKVAKKRRSELQELSSNERSVLTLIENESNKGIWIRDLRRLSGLSNPSLTKILQTLQKRELVKSVKSVAHKNKRVYMLFELEPALEVKGRLWYTNGEFDQSLHLVLGKFIKKQLSNNEGTMSVNDFVTQLRNSKLISDGTVPSEDILMRLQALVYDDVLEVSQGGDLIGCNLLKINGKSQQLNERRYALKQKRSAPTYNALLAPCVSCAVRSNCKEGNPTNPKDCIYFDRWLDGLDW